ncbi:uncharacterized protein LOC108300956 [Cebus imitator]|uniref:uncharacterized protein LOC108300956 n=1 Tax=Cebus imitator TaxID=2715852 RepID=UPI00080A61F6|nr:uncharacterized protein LOC108300956 [Cebus imitator]
MVLPISLPVPPQPPLIRLPPSPPLLLLTPPLPQLPLPYLFHWLYHLYIILTSIPITSTLITTAIIITIIASIATVTATATITTTTCTTTISSASIVITASVTSATSSTSPYIPIVAMQIALVGCQIILSIKASLEVWREQLRSKNNDGSKGVQFFNLFPSLRTGSISSQRLLEVILRTNSNNKLFLKIKVVERMLEDGKSE